MSFEKPLPKRFIFNGTLDIRCGYDGMFGDRIEIRMIEYDVVCFRPSEAYMFADKLKAMADDIEKNHSDRGVCTFCETKGNFNKDKYDIKPKEASVV